MTVFYLVLFLFIGLLLIGVILLQRGRGGGLVGAFGGGGGQSAFGTKTGDVFTTVTVITFAVFLLMALVLDWRLEAPSKVAAATPPAAVSTKTPGGLGTSKKKNALPGAAPAPVKTGKPGRGIGAAPTTAPSAAPKAAPAKGHAIRHVAAPVNPTTGLQNTGHAAHDHSGGLLHGHKNSSAHTSGTARPTAENHKALSNSPTQKPALGIKNLTTVPPHHRAPAASTGGSAGQ